MCTPGTLGARTGQTVCGGCAQGTFQDEDGATACRFCIQGNYVRGAIRTPCSTARIALAILTLSSTATHISWSVSISALSTLPALTTLTTFTTLYPDCRYCRYYRHYRYSQCPRGSSTPTPCPDGTYSTSTSLADDGGCKICPLGMACSRGTSEPEPCVAGRYGSTPGQVHSWFDVYRCTTYYYLLLLVLLTTTYYY